jgi:cell division protease FtsH
MVTEWGMSEKVGPISYGSDKEFFIGRDMQSHVTYSDKTAAIIDEEIRTIVDNGLQKARKLLAENRKLLDNMARLLVERETIFTEEVDLLMQGKSVEEIMEFMDENERTLRENPFERKKKSVIIPEQKKEEQNNEKETVETAEQADGENKE